VKRQIAVLTIPLAAWSFGCSSHHDRATERGETTRQESSAGRDEDGDEDEGENEGEEISEAVHDASASGEVRSVLEGKRSTRAVSFAETPLGSLPDGWRIEGTNQRGPPATWRVLADPSAPGGPNVLALSSPNHDSGSTFNLCWTDKIRFKDGGIEVAMKPISGKEDQGGGLIWRAKDKDNYYICRANPLESNFRVYYVRDAGRHQLGSASVEIETDKWHRIRIEQAGDHIVCALDGTKLLDVRDSTFPEEGGIGLWTKSDAASEFGDLQLTSVSPGERSEGERTGHR
jgi:hypothetical protein